MVTQIARTGRMREATMMKMMMKIHKVTMDLSAKKMPFGTSEMR